MYQQSESQHVPGTAFNDLPSYSYPRAMISLQRKQWQIAELGNKQWDSWFVIGLIRDSVALAFRSCCWLTQCSTEIMLVWNTTILGHIKKCPDNCPFIWPERFHSLLTHVTSIRSFVMLTYHPHLVATGVRFPSDLLSERVNFLFFLSVLHILPIYIPWFRYHNNTWCGFCDGLIARSEETCRVCVCVCVCVCVI